MNLFRVLSLARRVIRQISRDHRTVGLLAFGPMLVLVIGAMLFRADTPTILLGVVNEDVGINVPLIGSLNLGERIAESLSDSGYFEVTSLRRDEADAQLGDGAVQAVLLLPPQFTAQFQLERRVELDLHLEGSNPTRSQMIKARVMESATRGLGGLASSGLGLGAQGIAATPDLPVSVAATYLYAGEEFDTMDFIAPVYIAFLGLFFVFLLTCVSFLRERSQGTMERLLATPTTRLEIVLGYMIGLGLFALAQVSIILFFTIWVLKIHYLGNLALVFVVVVLLALVGVSMGMLASVFARNEFQVLQFIPLLIIPQVLLSGTFWAVEDMPPVLRPFSYLMPLTYANRALRDIMLKGLGLADIWLNLVIMLLVIIALTGLGALAMRQEVV